MLGALEERPGKSLPTAFQDWSNTKAAYRFFSNGNVSEDKILAGHFSASALCISATDGPILILQDTTEFSFKRADPQKVAFTHVSTGRKIKDGRYQKHAVSGLLMHASLPITPEGLPLGLTAAKFWSRSKFKGTRVGLILPVRAVARLGGYLDRASDAPPGTTVLWRGLSRLADLVEGARIDEIPKSETCG